MDFNWEKAALPPESLSAAVPVPSAVPLQKPRQFISNQLHHCSGWQAAAWHVPCTKSMQVLNLTCSWTILPFFLPQWHGRLFFIKNLCWLFSIDLFLAMKSGKKLRFWHLKQENLVSAARVLLPDRKNFFRIACTFQQQFWKYIEGVKELFAARPLGGNNKLLGFAPSCILT